MGMPPNPLQGAMAAMLMQKLAGGQGAPPGMGGPGGPGGMPGQPPTPSQGPGAAAAMGLNREMGSLRQADPMAMAKQLNDMKQQITTMISQSGMSIPGVARSLAKTLQGFDSAIKEAQTAATTAQIATPIQSSAAQGAPGMGGANTPPPSMGGGF